MTLIATPGAPDANSYCSVATATLYLEARLNTEPWFDQTVASVPPHWTLNVRREAALQWATQLLDEQVQWHGTPATDTQALAWPQQGQTDSWGRPIDATVIPEQVQRATAYYALALLRDTTEQPGQQGSGMIRRRKIGSLEIEYQATSTATTPSPTHQGIPAEVRVMLRPYGTLAGGVTVPLLRT